MKLDLAKILTEAEALETGEKICPLLSKYDVAQGAMQKTPDLLSFTVLCVGQKCGMFSHCNRVVHH